MNGFHTTAAYVSGAICGRMWMPEALAGKPIQKSLRGTWGFMPRDGQQWSFREALDHLLMREGGDFQHARFAADTVLRIERRRVDGPGRYKVHVFERELSKLHDCAELVDEDAYTCDFLGEE